MQSGAASQTVQPRSESVADQAAHSAAGGRQDRAATVAAASGDDAQAYGKYLAMLGLLILVLMGAVDFANRLLSPWVHEPEAKAEIADVLLAGGNYGFFDLNIDIRGIRRAQIAQMTKTPELIVLGASHWQEAHAGLMPGIDYFNGHVHRDYYDDHMAMVELLLVAGRLPKTLAITIRDSTFARVDARTDFLWLPFIPEFRMMEERLDLPRRPWWQDYWKQPVIDLFSLPTAVAHLQRLMAAEQVPGPNVPAPSDGLDVLMADGSILWSREHAAGYTPERTKALSLGMAADVRDRAPDIDPLAVESIERLLALLQREGVDVILVHPPFNPQFYDAVAGSAYAEGLAAVAALTQRLAADYDTRTAGSFDPRDVGCVASMYIDSEHGNPTCLGLLLQQVRAQIKP